MEPTRQDVIYKLGAIENAILNTNELIKTHIEEDQKIYSRVYELEIARIRDETKQKANAKWTTVAAGFISFIIASVIGVAQAIGIGK